MTLIKRPKQFYQLYSNYDRKFAQSNRQIPYFSRPSTLYPKQLKDFFQFSEIQGLFKAGLEFKPVKEPCY